MVVHIRVAEGAFTRHTRPTTVEVAIVPFKEWAFNLKKTLLGCMVTGQVI